MFKSLFSRPAVDAQKAMQQAVAARQEGRLADAERACKGVLQSEPSHLEALNLLGTVKLAQGNATDAARIFGEALAIDPGSLAVRLNETAALSALGRHAEALAGCERVLAIEPNRVDARCKRAHLLLKMNRGGEAEPEFVKVLEIEPDSFEALAGMGSLLDGQGRIDEALAFFARAIDVRPDDGAVRNDRASALFKQGRIDEAMKDWDWVLARDPENSVAHCGRGSVLYAREEYDAALAEYDRAVELAPDFAGAPFNRALVLNTLRRYDEAIAAYQWAIAIKPDFALALFNCAVLQEHQNRDDEALATFQRLLAVAPDYPYTPGNVVFFRSKMCAWDGRNEFVSDIVRSVKLGEPVTVPINLLSMSDDAAVQRACAESLVRRFVPADPRPRWTGEIYRHDRIRVAYLSADFHEHPTAFLSAGLFERHDHSRFEIFGVVFGLDHASPMRRRIEATFDHVIDIRKKSDAQAATLLRDLEVDIAVDLMGFTNWSRTGIFASRFAPVQVNYLGYPGTMGASYFDYIIGDLFLIPDAQRPHYTEEVVCLPDTFQANDNKRRIADRTPTRVEAGLPEDGLVLCCFNNCYKITPEMFAIWMRVLERVPGSVLWLVAGNPFVEPNLRREADRRGVAPSRLVFAKRLPADEYLAQYRLADLFLDTLPFNGGATVSDALWAGLPVVTCAGGAFASRMAGSLLHAIGLPELVTHSLADYEALALRLATDAPMLADLRQRLAHNRDTHPLFDTDRFRRNLEAAYVTMWEKTQRGEPPASFAVPG